MNNGTFEDVGMRTPSITSSYDMFDDEDSVGEFARLDELEDFPSILDELSFCRTSMATCHFESDTTKRTQLQKVARGFLARQHVARMQHLPAIVQIQSQIRRWIAQATQTVRAQAATKIILVVQRFVQRVLPLRKAGAASGFQAVWRGHHSRKLELHGKLLHKQMLLEREKQMLEQQLKAAIIAVQSGENSDSHGSGVAPAVLPLERLAEKACMIVALMTAKAKPGTRHELGSVIQRLYQKYPRAKVVIKSAGLSPAQFVRNYSTQLGVQVSQTEHRVELSQNSSSEVQTAHREAQRVARESTETEALYAAKEVIKSTHSIHSRSF
jgi:hypothetical protein